MINDRLHQLFLSRHQEIKEWYANQHTGLYIPFYSSYDIRDAGYKTVNVDANIYPAGFNNICEADREHSEELARYYIENYYGRNIQKIAVLCEEHTNNPYYWENVHAILQILKGAGYTAHAVVPPGNIQAAFTAQTLKGHTVEVRIADYQNGKIQLNDFMPDLVISNNDFSKSYHDWANQIDQPLNPPRELGWYQRKKSGYFEHYNALATDFAKVLQVDPWQFTVATDLLSDFDVAEEKSRLELAQRVQVVLDRTQKKYDELGIKEKPFAFVKNNSGTYGLGVIQVNSAEEAAQLNYKSKKKMKAAKGGRDVDEVIIQEGVPSIVKSEESTAEPTLYMLGCQLAGGFLRTHKEKTERESLNSPGAVYMRLCVSDLEINVEGKPLENVYGWIARLGVLAIGRETQSMGVSYKDYHLKKCSQ